MDAPTQSLIARENFKSVADLKGKKVVISSFGTSAHVTTVLIFRHFGNQPGEVNFVAGGPDRARLAMLEQGLADAAILNPFAKGLRLCIDESKAALKTDREVSLSEVADFSVLAEAQKELTKVGRK